MAVGVLPKWVSFWFFVSGLVVIWDALWVLFARYHYNEDASPWKAFTAAAWEPYITTYIRIDTRYGDFSDGFVVAQSWINLVEVLLAFVALKQSWFGNRAAILTGFISALFTFIKTVIYFGCEVFSQPPFEFTQAAAPFDFWVLFVLPSSFWVVIPGLISLVLGSHIWEALQATNTRVVPKAAAPSASMFRQRRQEIDVNVKAGLDGIDQLKKAQ